MIQIRPIVYTDYTVWKPMWDLYCDDPETITPKFTRILWNRLISPDGPIRGIVAHAEDGTILGFCHYVLHFHTWSPNLVCHCEDLFVTEAARNMGVGKAILRHLLELGVSQGWNRIYGTTDADNDPARHLYGKFVEENRRRLFVLRLPKKT